MSDPPAERGGKARLAIALPAKIALASNRALEFMKPSSGSIRE
jgi:hypothetical protein